MTMISYVSWRLFRHWAFHFYKYPTSYIYDRVVVNMCMVSVSLFAYICIAVGDPIIKRDRVAIPLIVLILTDSCICPKSGPRFQRQMACVFCVNNDFGGDRWLLGLLISVELLTVYA
jgi:hypothetical protein